MKKSTAKKRKERRAREARRIQLCQHFEIPLQATTKEQGMSNTSIAIVLLIACMAFGISIAWNGGTAENIPADELVSGK